MTAPKATPEQWADTWAFASDTRACLLELRDRVAALEAAATPSPAPNHSRGAPEMVATDEELVEAFRVCSSLRDIYNLGRQHGAQPRQEGEPAPPPARPPHGYAYRYRSIRGVTVIRFNCGQEVDGSRPIEAVPYWLGEPPIDLRTPASQPAPPPAPAGGLVESVTEEICHVTGDRVSNYVSRDVIRVVANWLQQRSGTIANGSQWADVLLHEANR